MFAESVALAEEALPLVRRIVAQHRAVVQHDGRSEAECFGGLDEALMLRVVSQLRQASSTASRERITRAMCFAHPEFRPLWRGDWPITCDEAHPICAEYPRAPLTYQYRAVLGFNPLVPGLSAREAHEMLSGGHATAVDYLFHGKPPIPLPLGKDRVTIWMARWLIAAWANPDKRAALVRDRAEVRNGAIVEGSYLRRLDELAEVDLTSGARTGVAAAFEAASRRIVAREEARGLANEKALEGRHSFVIPYPEWWTDVPHVKLLRHRGDLKREGAEMRHCVGEYEDEVRDGDCLIVSVRVLVGLRMMKSTAELTNDDALEVVQHQGPRNEVPHKACVMALDAALTTWRQKISFTAATGD